MQFWRTLSERERRLITVAAAIFAAFVAYQGVAAPVFSWRAEQHHALAEAQGLYELVTQAGARAGGVAVNAGDNSTPVRNAMSQSASAAGVSLVYVNVRPDGAVETNAALVDPAALFDWLQTLERDYGARVISADIAREQEQTSMVRAQLVLARQGGA